MAYVIKDIGDGSYLGVYNAGFPKRQRDALKFVSKRQAKHTVSNLCDQGIEAKVVRLVSKVKP